MTVTELFRKGLISLCSRIKGLISLCIGSVARNDALASYQPIHDPLASYQPAMHIHKYIVHGVSHIVSTISRLEV